ncbi:MAG: YccF domain-containing protein [Firmicutes bacterium]|nr:YccF domain-containing protein [Bacillota bacterium]
MSCLGNLIWILCGGIWQALAWFLMGLVWCVTVISIPIGLQCFKFASLALAPFEKEVIYGGGAPSLLANILWILISGIPLAVCAAVNGLLLCCTIIGIPFGLQCFKIAKLALMPFGAKVV